MTRRTPLLALLLAPVVLFALLLLWQFALGPLYRSVWYGATAVQWRLDSSDAKTREQALHQAMSLHPPEATLIAKIVAMAGSDPAPSVRYTAVRSLGQLGTREPLPDAARQALIGAVLSAPDAGMVDAAMTAVGTSAAKNTYPDEIARRAAQALADSDSRIHHSATEALGPLGAAQPLPADVFETLNAVFVRRDRTGIREPLARAFAQIAAARPLPAATLDLLAAALGSDRNETVRAHAILALAYCAADYPPAEALIAAAPRDPSPNVQAAARNGVRIIQNRQMFAGRTPVEVALDRTAPVPARLRGIELLEVRRDDAASREQIVTLAGDDDARVAAAALGKLHHAVFSPDDEFDRQQLIPVLRAALTHGEPKVRAAAFGALSRLLRQRRADDFRAALEAGAADADADVRLVALATLVRIAPNAAAADAIRARALQDTDPKVRQSAAGWLASVRSSYDDRQSMIEMALQDPVDSVRAAAAAAQKEWDSQRNASWPRQLLQMLRDGEFGKLGMSVLTFSTIAAPIVVGGGFLVYYMARLLTYLFQRRWRALAVLPVMAVWSGTSFGMFLLYFAAGHAKSHDPWSIFLLAAVLWTAIALYAGLGWGMHYLIRR